MANLFLKGFDLCCNVYNCTDPCRQTMDRLTANYYSLMTSRRTLLAIMTSLQSEVKASGGLQITPTVRLIRWLNGSNVIVTQLNNVLGTEETAPRPLPEMCPGGCFYRDCCGTYEYAKKVENLVTITANLIQEAAAFGPGDKFIINEMGLEAATPEDVDLIGMDGKFEEAWTFLDKEGFGSLGIHGMGGVGKTALLNRIQDKLLEEDLSFDRDWLVRVEMSDAVDISSIRLAIGKKLGLLTPRDEVSKRQIMAALFNKKFVLLLDDLPDKLQNVELDLAKIGIPIRNNQNKSKVIFTTKNKELCYKLGGDQNIELECLKEEDPWILFKNVVGETTLGSHEGINDRAKTLVNLCEGLPLALVIMGGSMRGKTSPDDWDLAIQRLRTLSLQHYGMDKVYRALKVSYDSLPETTNNIFESSFLYVSLFPKTCLAHDEELIHYWIAEEILKEFDQLRENIVHGRSIIESLKRAYLLNHGNGSNIVNMHDMVRAAALRITTKNFFVPLAETLAELPTNANWAEVERMSLIGKSIGKLNKFQFNSLSTLILKKSTISKVAYNFFDSMPSLRVLDLSWCNIGNFPKNITKLTTLQYLNISHNNISKLPTELQQLKKLKFLDLSYLQDLHLIRPQVLVSLSKLQSLNLYHSGFGMQIHESNALPAEDEGNAVSASSGGNVLSGDGVALLKELEQLNHLDNLGLTVKSRLAVQALQKFKKLKCLHSLFITNCKKLSSLQVSSLHTAEKLKVLRVHNCSDLKEFTICWGTDRDATNRVVAEELHESIGIRRSFQNLLNIEIEGCWVLKDLSWLKYVPLLQLLKIERCGQIEEVISNDENSLVVVLESNENLFSKLRSIYLSNLPELKVFCNNALILPVLEQITVLYCPKMVKLPLKAENATGTLKLIKINKHLWDELTLEEEAMKSDFLRLCEFE